MIKAELHSNSFERAAGCVLKYRASLICANSREPLDEIMERSIVFKVLEQRNEEHAYRERPTHH